MAINEKLQQAVNDQLEAELQSAYQYLALSSWFTQNNLPGFAHWMMLQWQEEVGHGMKFYNFLHARNGTVDLHALDAPRSEFGSVLAVFELVLAGEQMITKRINALYELAMKEKDYPLQMMLQWFINEQVEEEGMVTAIIDRLKMIGTEGTAIYLMDRELAQRSSATERSSL
jgi:ferritin